MAVFLQELVISSLRNWDLRISFSRTLQSSQAAHRAQQDSAVVTPFTVAPRLDI